MSEGTTGEVDFDLHGFVGIRLVAAGPAEVAVVERQVGPLRRRLGRDPDITVRFVERLDVETPLVLIGHQDAGFTERDFIVLRGRHKSSVRVAVPLDRLGRGCEVVCERGVPAVPMLIPMINMVALAHGVVPLHASAFVYEGTGVLVTGWAKGGKTETLLSFMARGASYVGDEWVYLAPDGTMRGIPEPIRFWNWHLRELPAFRRRIPRADRARLESLDRAAGASRWLGARTPRAPGRLAARAVPLLRNQAYVQLPPHRLFGADRCRTSAPLDRVVLAVSHDDPSTSIERIDASEVVDRMLASNEHERLEFSAAYLKHRYAFPDRRSTLIEEAPALEREALRRVLERRPAWLLRHPYPVSIPGLHDVVWPAIRRRADGPAAEA